MDVVDGDSCSNNSGSSAHDIDEDEFYYLSNHMPKLQIRKEVSKAHWNVELGVAEIIQMKGQMWKTTGVVRHGKIYCFIEETLYLAEIGGLNIFMNNGNAHISLNDMYKKVAAGQGGCCWEAFEAYKHLKSLGYIVGRHGIPWTSKTVRSDSATNEDICRGELTINTGLRHETSITEIFQNMQFNDLRPVFDVYHPNGKFRKSLPGDPGFILCLSSSNRPPSRWEIEYLGSHCHGCPLKFCHVVHGCVSFFSINKVDLPILP